MLKSVFNRCADVLAPQQGVVQPGGWCPLCEAKYFRGTRGSMDCRQRPRDQGTPLPATLDFVSHFCSDWNDYLDLKQAATLSLLITFRMVVWGACECFTALSHSTAGFAVLPLPSCNHAGPDACYDSCTHYPFYPPHLFSRSTSSTAWSTRARTE